MLWRFFGAVRSLPTHHGGENRAERTVVHSIRCHCLDVGLPDLNCRNAARRLRDNSRFASIVLIAPTRSVCRALGLHYWQ